LEDVVLFKIISLHLFLVGTYKVFREKRGISLTFQMAPKVAMPEECKYHQKLKGFHQIKTLPYKKGEKRLTFHA
jgi:hypothetical protein